MNFAIKSALTLGTILGAKRLAGYLAQYDFDDALGLVGLERRPNPMSATLPAVGLVALGAAIGAGAALALTPYSGKQLRERLAGRVSEARHRLEDAAERSLGRAGHAQSGVSS